MNRTITNLLQLQRYILEQRPSINLWTHRHDVDQNCVLVKRGNPEIGVGGCIIGISAFSQISSLHHGDRFWMDSGDFDWDSYIAETFPQLSTEITNRFFGFNGWIITEVEAAVMINQVVTLLVTGSVLVRREEVSSDTDLDTEDIAH